MADKTIITGRHAKAADLYAIHTMGIESLRLMENASRAAAEYIAGKHPAGVPVLILCGVGNNGADGLCIGSLLKEKGYEVSAVTAGSLSKASEEFLFQKKRAENAGVPLRTFDGSAELPAPEKPAILVDAVFGIGLRRPVEGLYAEMMEQANRMRDRFTEVVAVDVPSGINADDGRLMGIAIMADVTVTFGRNKTGLTAGLGKRYAGEVIVAEIGIPDEAYEKTADNKDI